MTSVLVVHSGRLDPVENMALDEAALLAPDARLRIYGWSPAGLSLGYFQRYADFADEPGEHVVVRRATGGGAILHDDEITFALTGPAELLPRDLGASYDLVHDAIRTTLARFGVTTRRHGRGPASCRPDERWCFAKPTCHDLTTPRGKIVGSAQRRTGGSSPRFLHHGSIFLRPPSWPATSGSVAEFVDPDVVRDELEHELATAIVRALGCDAATGAEPPDDIETARDAVRARLRRR
ncbi:MAG: lipoate--protein ligase family protein [Planctomycetes bacterium]|nr:lipoate--protein ligase family protein [Planctomycetota bacterium]